METASSGDFLEMAQPETFSATGPGDRKEARG